MPRTRIEDPADRPAGRAIRVLVADDSPAFRKVAGQVIGLSPGFELAATAASGEEAVRLTEELRPQLALIDVRMPGMGGIDAALEIASRVPEVRVVLISGGLREDAPGVSAINLPYLPKTMFGPTALRDLWERALRASRPAPSP